MRSAQDEMVMEPIPSWDEGTKVCPQCKYMAEHNGKDNHHIAHDPSCPESRFYKDFLAKNAYCLLKEGKHCKQQGFGKKEGPEVWANQGRKVWEFGNGYNEDDLDDFFAPKKGAVPTYTGPLLPDS